MPGLLFYSNAEGESPNPKIAKIEVEFLFPKPSFEKLLTANNPENTERKSGEYQTGACQMAGGGLVLIL